jgi:4'-phosphopantetheinyl transferase
LADSLFNEVSRSAPDFEIPSGEVHVWILNTGGQERAWDRLLSSEEAATAGRLSTPHQLRFKNCRGALRLLLGRYLRLNPTSIEFSIGPNGKLFLAGGQLGFNVAHSRDVAVIALGQDCEVGVDVEGFEAPANCAQLAAQFFRPEEIDVLSRVSPAMYGRTFLTMWVRKEATLKAEGTGIGDGLVVSVPHLTPMRGAEVRLGTGENEHRSFYIYDINPGNCFVAALAASRKVDRIVMRVMED